MTLNPTPVAPAWTQCGGVGWTGSHICPGGFYCHNYTQNYSQCILDMEAVPVWGQCGGLAFTGNTNCIEGAHCQYLNAYYSQCVAGPATPTVTVICPTLAAGQ
ncbi:hypothetical protein ONZ45_g12390 [Pleurotus djamor]|nr:hypothetical protein ONZ45_g12390 [Pleurotus djamor]